VWDRETRYDAVFGSGDPKKTEDQEGDIPQRGEAKDEKEKQSEIPYRERNQRVNRTAKGPRSSNTSEVTFTEAQPASGHLRQLKSCGNWVPTIIVVCCFLFVYCFI
jgi:hypothetical protein